MSNQPLMLPDPNDIFGLTDPVGYRNRPGYLGADLMPKEWKAFKILHPDIAKGLVVKNYGSWGVKLVGDKGLNRYQLQRLNNYLFSLEP